MVNVIAGNTFQSMRNGTSPAEHHLLMHPPCYLSDEHTIPPLLTSPCYILEKVFQELLARSGIVL
jgi:hypothetical protein